MRLRCVLVALCVVSIAVDARVGEEKGRANGIGVVEEDEVYWERLLDDTSMSLPAPTAAPTEAAPPDFGSNVMIFSPDMPTSEIQTAFDTIWQQQRNDEMGTNRRSLLFLPGVYGTDEEPLQIKVGYYTEVAGLGTTPESVEIIGKVEVYNRCFEPDPYNEGKFIPTDDVENALCFALNNFWRSLSNLSVTINNKGQDGCRAAANFWAVSQASSTRRVDFRGGDVSLMDFCSTPAFASGGFIADSRAGVITNGSQQQWITRNTELGEWSNAVWNQFFAGVSGAPDDATYPDPAYTTLEKTPLSREKAFLYIDDNGEYNVRVPFAQRDSSGITWADGKLTPGKTLPIISEFFIAEPSDSVDEINRQLAQGKHLIFTPGVYNIGKSINIVNADTVVLGMGQATLTAIDGAIPLTLADQPGIIISGMTIDAGDVESPVLLQVGTKDSGALARSSDPNNPTTLHDVYFRIGGPHIGKTDIALEINSDNVLIDHTWVWRADHGVEGFDTNDGFEGDNERWIKVIGRNGVVVNGNDVTAIGLFVEHFQEHNVIWNGERGRVYFFQNELPYDPPSQADWTTPDGTLGWSAYKINDSVTTHELWAGGVYCYNRNDPTIVTENGWEVPETPGVRLRNIMTKNLSGPGVINHVVNGVGDTVDGEFPPEDPDQYEDPSYVVEYPEKNG
jgi:hypothetical protein